MSKRFIITEEEKNSILNAYLKLNEAPTNNKCEQGDCINGTGTLKYSNGNVYVGPFKNGNRHGTGGVLTYTNGDVFRVKFVDDKMDGYGVYVTSDNISYTGLWTQTMGENNLPAPIPQKNDGNFVVLYPEDMGGYSYVGYFGSQGFNGKGRFEFPDGTKYDGEFSQNSLGIAIPINFQGVDNKNNEVSTIRRIWRHLQVR
jgi:hypothetical protein